MDPSKMSFDNVHPYISPTTGQLDHHNSYWGMPGGTATNEPSTSAFDWRTGTPISMTGNITYGWNCHGNFSSVTSPTLDLKPNFGWRMWERNGASGVHAAATTTCSNVPHLNWRGSINNDDWRRDIANNKPETTNADGSVNQICRVVPFKREDPENGTIYDPSAVGGQQQLLSLHRQNPVQSPDSFKMPQTIDATRVTEASGKLTFKIQVHGICICLL